MYVHSVELFLIWDEPFYIKAKLILTTLQHLMVDTGKELMFKNGN